MTERKAASSDGTGFITRLSRIIARSGAVPKDSQEKGDVLDRYVSSLPSHQNAIDAVPGWTGAMPPDSGLVAGESSLYADHRIAWLLRTCFPVAGKSVLELGPLEASHTYMLDRAGALSIDSIEANVLAYVRCLIVKEALDLKSAKFYLGDFQQWLDQTEKRYDLIVASGVLYHLQDPVGLLESIARRTDAFYLWTHYFDETAMPPGDIRRGPFSGVVEVRQAHGVEVHLHERSYRHAWENVSFCGGMRDRHYWIDRGDILEVISALGFDHVVTTNEKTDHVNGPSFGLFAQRTSSRQDVPTPPRPAPGQKRAGKGSLWRQEQGQPSRQRTDGPVRRNRKRVHETQMPPGDNVGAEPSFSGAVSDKPSPPSGKP